MLSDKLKRETTQKHTSSVEGRRAGRHLEHAPHTPVSRLQKAEPLRHYIEQELELIVTIYVLI